MNDSDFKKLCDRADKAQAKSYVLRKLVDAECARRYGFTTYSQALHDDCAQLPDLFLKGCPPPHIIDEAITMWRDENPEWAEQERAEIVEELKG